MFSEDKYYSVEPVYKKVTKEEFRKFSEFIYSDMDENSLYLYRKRNRNTTISQEKTFFTRSNSPQRA